MLCAMAVLLIGFMGIAIFTGLQGYLESDLQRASMNAALAGAAAYYSGTDSTGKPIPDPAQAGSIARSTFQNIVDNSSLKGFQATIKNVSSSNSNDSITVTSTASLGTPLLAPIGITLIETTATASARALSYEPIGQQPLQLVPQAGNIASYSKVLDLVFPIVDGPGQELYIEQDPSWQQGYVVEGCNKTECYNLVPGATPVGTSRITSVNGTQVIYGTVIIDLGKAGVRKAGKIRITHANANPFDYYDHGAGPMPLPASAQTVPFIKRIMIFGYSGACVKESVCPIPAGFVPVG